MEAQIDHTPVEEDVQIYRNEFLSGVLMLAKKLFML
jgi:hypothetical protein